MGSIPTPNPPWLHLFLYSLALAATLLSYRFLFWLAEVLFDVPQFLRP